MSWPGPGGFRIYRPDSYGPFAYLLYPFPDLSLMGETNDALIAALCVWGIVAAQRPVTRGLLLAAAALTKFLPVLMAVQFLGVRRGRSLRADARRLARRDARLAACHLRPGRSSTRRSATS